MKHNKIFLFIMEIFRKLIRMILFKKYQKLTKVYLKREGQSKKQRQKIEMDCNLEHEIIFNKSRGYSIEQNR